MVFAHVFQRDGKLYVRTLSKTTTGVLIGSGEVIELAADAANENLGAAVQRALGESRQNLPHPAPAEWPDATKRFLTGVGAKSMAAFMKGAVCTGVVSDGTRVILEPTRNAGTRGFVELKDRQFEVAAHSTTEEIGCAVREALRLSS